MSWVRTIPCSEAVGRLKALYDRIKGKDGYIDNILTVHSLRPHSLEAHLTLYKYVLHHSDNSIPKRLSECLGLYVSMLNGCAYCVRHHYAGLRRILMDDERAAAIKKAFQDRRPARAFQGKELELVRYAEKLTLAPAKMVEGDVQALRAAGCDDGEILEANQVIAYFGYANRTALGLGVTTEGDILGLSPSSDDPDEWSHR